MSAKISSMFYQKERYDKSDSNLKSLDLVGKIKNIG